MAPLCAALVLAASLLAAVTSAAPAADEVTSLPGWSGPLRSRMYSGFIDAGFDFWEGQNRTMHMWYTYTLAEVADPTTAPSLLFSNGGPGASSAFGEFTEWGPYLLSDASLATSPPTLFTNPYSWTKLANVLILNGPSPVGFSYCTPPGPGGDGYACGSWNDTRSAKFNVAFVAGWAKLFPEFTKSDFFIAGE